MTENNQESNELSNKASNLWEFCVHSQTLDKEQIEQLLIQKLGQPTDQLAINCLNSLTKKVFSYYGPEEKKNNSTSVFNCNGTVQEIVEKISKGESRNTGQTFYVLKLTNNERLQAYQENLKSDKWLQIQNLAILGQFLVFKYQKWITNKHLLDFYSPESEPNPNKPT